MVEIQQRYPDGSIPGHPSPKAPSGRAFPAIRRTRGKRIHGLAQFIAPFVEAEALRAMAGRAGAEVTEAPGSHAIYVSSPEAAASVIKHAAVKAPAPAS
jgi:hypothetical protein